MGCCASAVAAVLAALATSVGLAAGLSAQTYDELTTVRGRPSPYASVVQVRAGLLGGVTASEDPDRGLENQFGWDGHVYYHQERFADRDSTLDVYAGRDGAYLGVTDGAMTSGSTQSRLELSTRYFPFYREGFYRGHDFIPTGRYESFDWGPQLTFAHMLDQSLRAEVGAFYRRMEFDANETTGSYEIPDNFNAYGARMFIEQNTLELDRLDGRPRQGFILTLVGEREQNDSDKEFGSAVFQSHLPSGLWRARGRLEWYFPQSEGFTWVVGANGQWTDEQDRIYNADAQKPQGNLWVDGVAGVRIDFSRVLSVQPFVEAQFLQILDESGVSKDSQSFFGGGARTRLDFGDALSMFLDYSYLNNQSRPPVSVTQDTFAEHRFFLGVEARFGAQRQ